MSISSSSSSSSSSIICISKTFKFSPPKTSIYNNHPNSFTQFKFTPNLNASFSLSLLKTQKSSPQFTLIKHSQIQSMFTGIVEEVGEIKHIGISKTNTSEFNLKIRGKTVLQDINLGDSIAVNGTCLTVTQFNTESSEFTVGVSPETLRLTTLTDLKPGTLINLERAVTPTTRMGGHFVQGHVDGTGEIVEMEREGNSLWIKIRCGSEVFRYIVAKGFVAIDGTSLTVVKVFDEMQCCFNVMMVEYTQQNVVMPLKKVGDTVNLEVDVLGKYVEKVLSTSFVGDINKNILL